MKLFANIISGIFHPLLMVTYGVMMFFMFTYLSLFPFSIQLLFIGVTFLMTALIPGLSIYLMMERGIVHDFDLTRRRERAVPYLIFIIGLLGGGLFLRKMMIPVWMLYPLLGTIIALILALVINFFWKISAHGIGVGGFLGGLMGIAQILLFNPYWAFIVLIIIAGLVGTSRIYLKRHTPMQFYAGFCLGFICTFASSLLNYVFIH